MRVVVLVIGLLFGSVSTWWWLHGETAQHAAAPDDDEDAGTAVADVSTGAVATGSIVLEAEAAALAGLELHAVEAAAAAAESQHVGRVVDAAELLRARHAQQATQAQRAAHASLLTALETRVRHLRDLQRAGQVSAARELAQLELDVAREQARGLALDARAMAEDDALRARWGAALAARLATDAALRTALEDGRDCLIAFGAGGAAVGMTLHVAPAAGRVQASPGEVLAAAPAVVSGSAMASWFVRAPCGDFRVGMPVALWLPTAGAARSGVGLPAAALLWHAGQRWYYIEQAPGHYQRRALATGAASTAQGRLLVVTDLAPGTKVVVRGAQMLLAEEQRAAIPDEDDD